MISRWLRIALVGGSCSLPLAAQPLPHVDISWDVEHLPESLQDSRLLALPWPNHALVPGRSQTTVDLGWQSATADLGKAAGFLASAGVTRARSERFGWGGFAFYDRLSFSGDGTRDLLRPTFSRQIPLALPAFADFTDPRGEVRHWGLGGDAVWQRQGAGKPWRRTVLAGAYFERLEVSGFRFDYQLVSGPDAGTRGVLDWSGSYSFVTPFVGVAWTRNLGSRWTVSPRLIAAQPLPRRGLEGSISGPGFLARGTEKTKAVGDGYLGAGLVFEHRPTGLGIDLGSGAYYAGTESVTHEGLSRAILLHISWTH